MSRPYAETLRALADTYEELGLPLPLDIAARLQEEGHILTDHENHE